MVYSGNRFLVSLEGKMIARLITINPYLEEADRIVSLFRLELTQKIRDLPGCKHVTVYRMDAPRTVIYVFSLWQDNGSLEKSSAALTQLLDQIKDEQMSWPNVETG